MSRFTFCNCPAGFNADPERHAPDCPGRSGAGKRPMPVPETIKPAEQHQASPVVWMVGSAIHWTNEDAERDAAVVGLPVVALGPMAGKPPVVQRQGEPVAVVDESDDGLFIDFIYGENGNPLRRGDKLYTHPAPADAGEVERLRSECRDLRLQLRGAAHLADRLRKSSLGLRRQALAELIGYLSSYSASAEPSAPVERDERAAYDAWRHSESGYVRPFDRHEWSAWKARAALNHKS